MNLSMMKNTIIIILSFLFIAGCSSSLTIPKETQHVDTVKGVTKKIEVVNETSKEAEKNIVLFDLYFDYMENFTGAKFTELAEKYFSQSLIDETKSNEVSVSVKATARLLFKYEIDTTDSYYENISLKSGCLTVNGFNKKKSPLVLSLQYALINKEWLIKDIHLERIKNVKDFSSSVMCPKEFTNK